jgi:serine/threonine-protein kinase
LGDFHVLRKLGQGGMGQVYLAEQISLKRKVALKILRPDLAANTQSLARFKLEAEAVARATHANIVQVYAFDAVDGIPYMALEYVEGRTLKEFVARKGTPELLVCVSIMRQVASALQRASELGIIHRDIKPENILITRKGEVKVADFGLARCLETEGQPLNLTQTGVSMGTPLYMSPEQVEGKPVDSRTDIYSFGVTCYYLLTGRPPFEGATAFEVALAHVRSVPKPLTEVRPDLPELLCAVVHRMMAKDPAQRYQTGKELLRDIARVREGASGATGAITLPPPLPTVEPTLAMPTPPRPRAGWIAGIVGSLVFALLVGAAIGWRERRNEGPIGGNAIPPSDASVIDAIPLPNKREQALRLLVEQALNVSGGKAPDNSGLNNAMELGLIYLDSNRLQEADDLFTRLMKYKEPASYIMMGQAGKGIVLALQNKAKESNTLFRAVFAPFPQWVGPLVRDKKGKGQPAMNRKIEEHVKSITALLDHPRGKHWLAKARWYNDQNGVRMEDVPRYLLWRFPLEKEVKK